MEKKNMNKKDIASKKKYRCLYEAKREQYVEYLKNHLSNV